jgi:putative transferase (TIGR04331 family)
MFLATTAIPAFWETKDKIIFLGPWCLTSENATYRRKLDYEIMPSPWKDRETYYEAGLYTYKIYQHLLENLSEYLNGVHNTKHTKRFWQIIIGPWLFNFIDALYSRYLCVQEAISRYSPINTIFLDKTSYITPNSSKELVDLCCLDDVYNLQLFSQIFKEVGLSCSTKRLVRLNNQLLKNNSLKNDLMILFKRTLNALSRYLAGNRPIIMWDLYLSNYYIMKYITVSNFKSLPILFYDSKFNFNVIADNKRFDLAGLSAQDEFTRVLLNTLPVNFPPLYLEGFKAFYEETITSYKVSPKILVSAIGWYSNERFKFLSAHLMEKGTKLCGMQHGGIYGTAKWTVPEKHEIDITDYYYTWGWVQKDKSSVKALANPKISYLASQRNSFTKKSQFLFAGTSYPRYQHRICSSPSVELFEEYFDWRIIFLKHLTDNNRNRILMRLFPTDYGRSEKEQIQRVFPEIRFDNHKTGFLSRLNEAQVAIIDHPDTVMLESLARNIPTILFWNPHYWEMRPEAEPFFEELAYAGICHQNPQDAAQFLNEISHNPLGWWQEAKTQRARNRFVRRFALSDKNWARKWWDEMQQILKSVSPVDPHI